MAQFVPGLRNQIVLSCGEAIGDKILPILPGSTISLPLNMQVPQVISGSNVYQYNMVEGLQFPVVTIQTLIMASWFSGAAGNLLASMFTRTNDDVAEIGSLKYWDGWQGWAALGCKLDYLRLGASQGDMIRATMRFLGRDWTEQTHAAGAFLTTVITDAPAMSQHTQLGGSLTTGADGAGASSILSWELALMNNLMPSPELSGTIYPKEFNSGQFTSSVRLLMQVSAAQPPNGEEMEFTVKTPDDGATPGSGAHDNEGSGGATFTIINPEAMDPRERSVQVPRQTKEINYICKGSDTMDFPVTIADAAA